MSRAMIDIVVAARLQNGLVASFMETADVSCNREDQWSCEEVKISDKSLILDSFSLGERCARAKLKG